MGQGPSPYNDVNELVQFYTEEVKQVLGENLRGVYLTGSLSCGTFDYGSSDIDITVIVHHAVSADELDAIRGFHRAMEEKFAKWARRLECTYTPAALLGSIAPPREPRPWYWGGEGVLYEAAPYGNEWIINNYLLYQHGIALYGPEFRELTGPVDIEEVQKACIRDLFKEWEPRSNDEAWFTNSHYASYFVLNLCRILYTVMRKRAGSKKTAAVWLKRRYGDPWKGLIRTAEQWHYGVELDLRERAIAFLGFVIDEISRTPLYGWMVDEVGSLRGVSGDSTLRT